MVQCTGGISFSKEGKIIGKKMSEEEIFIIPSDPSVDLYNNC